MVQLISKIQYLRCFLFLTQDVQILESQLLALVLVYHGLVSSRKVYLSNYYDQICKARDPPLFEKSFNTQSPKCTTCCVVSNCHFYVLSTPIQGIGSFNPPYRKLNICFCLLA
jgi:hypothetical protein